MMIRWGGVEYETRGEDITEYMVDLPSEMKMSISRLASKQWRSQVCGARCTHRMGEGGGGGRINVEHFDAMAGAREEYLWCRVIWMNIK